MLPIWEWVNKMLVNRLKRYNKMDVTVVQEIHNEVQEVNNLSVLISQNIEIERIKED